MTRDRLLALLKQVETNGHGDLGRTTCPSCCADAYWRNPLKHDDDCELKAAIDWLEQMPDGVSLHCSDWWKRGMAGPPREPVR